MHGYRIAFDESGLVAVETAGDARRGRRAFGELPQRGREPVGLGRHRGHSPRQAANVLEGALEPVGQATGPADLFGLLQDVRQALAEEPQAGELLAQAVVQLLRDDALLLPDRLGIVFLQALALDDAAEFEPDDAHQVDERLALRDP